MDPVGVIPPVVLVTATVTFRPLFDVILAGNGHTVTVGVDITTAVTVTEFVPDAEL
jgi:hypothetical protein